MNKKQLVTILIILFFGVNSMEAQCSFAFSANIIDAHTRQFNYINNNMADSNTLYQWIFGDGDSANTSMATHTFVDTGLYRVCLSVNYIDAGCRSDTCMYVRIDTCRAYFNYTYNPSLSQPEEDIYFFIDSSTGVDSATLYNWSFGTGDFSSLKNPAFTYEPGDSGLEQICLTIHNTDNGCTNQYCRTLRVDNLCIAGRYTYNLQGNTCTFLANICGTWDSISWNFGDGTTSNQGDSQVHTFPAATDSYYVCMEVMVTSECQNLYPCKSIYCQQIRINPASLENIPSPDNHFQVFPNPACSYFRLSSTRIQFPAVLKITDIMGNTLRQMPVENEFQQINIHDWEAGIYFIQVNSPEGQIVTTRFMKQ